MSSNKAEKAAASGTGAPNAEASGTGTEKAAASGRMNSITRSLVASYTRRELGLIIVSTLILYIMATAAYFLFAEVTALGALSGDTLRTLEFEKDQSGDLTAIIYTLTADGKATVLDIMPPLKIILTACVVILIVRLLYFFIVSVPHQNRKTKKLLKPLNELALRADELSRLEFGENKYQQIEDAISHLDAQGGASLSLGDRDLLGIEAAINNLLMRVRESNRQQARFVNDASHELRTPIAVISGYADMLSRWGKNDEKVLDESIAAIQKESTRMKHLVEQLLFLARGDSGRTALQLEETDLRALMQEAYEESVMIDEDHVYRFVAPEPVRSGDPGSVHSGDPGTVRSGEAWQSGEPGYSAEAASSGRSVSGQSGEQGSSIEPGLSNEPGLTVIADEGLLKQAVRILIDNAAKYTKEHDEIILSVGTSDGHPFLQVQDDGIGMAEADVVHMFDRFYRADDARSFEGTGLGLSIAKWIVDKHGGHFEILSRMDIGTRVRIVL